MACALVGLKSACREVQQAHQQRGSRSLAAWGNPWLPQARQCSHWRRSRYLTAAASSQSMPTGTADEVTQLKARLLQAVSRSNSPQPGDNLVQLEREVESLAAELAAANPTPDAAQSPLLQGAWALLFSGRSRQLAAAAFAGRLPAGGGGPRQALQAASDAAYSTFYRYVPVLAGSAVGRQRGAQLQASNLQVLAGGRVDNVVTTKGPLPLRLCVSGSVETVPAASGRPTSCVAVTFDRFTARVGQLPSMQLPLSWLSPVGYVDTLYLDGQLRVSVGDKGGLFVLRRVAEPQQ